MGSNELVVGRAAAGEDLLATLKAQAEAKFAAALEQANLELTVSDQPSGPFQWEIFARGPYQEPAFSPGRIITMNETAYIDVVVWMNASLFKVVKNFGADILLNFWTSNTQTMEPVADLSTYVCLEPTPAPFGGMYSTYVWKFTPKVAACLLETNICARLCNCDNFTVPGFAGFVRWVQDFDAELLFPNGPVFDHPIRYMVYDPNEKCWCPD